MLRNHISAFAIPFVRYIDIKQTDQCYSTHLMCNSKLFSKSSGGILVLCCFEAGQWKIKLYVFVNRNSRTFRLSWYMISMAQGKWKAERERELNWIKLLILFDHLFSLCTSGTQIYVLFSVLPEKQNKFSDSKSQLDITFHGIIPAIWNAARTLRSVVQMLPMQKVPASNLDVSSGYGGGGRGGKRMCVKM